MKQTIRNVVIVLGILVALWCLVKSSALHAEGLYFELGSTAGSCRLSADDKDDNFCEAGLTFRTFARAGYPLTKHIRFEAEAYHISHPERGDIEQDKPQSGAMNGTTFGFIYRF